MRACLWAMAGAALPFWGSSGHWLVETTARAVLGLVLYSSTPPDIPAPSSQSFPSFYKYLRSLIFYMIPMAQCQSDFSDFIPTLWMEIFHVVVLCFSWQAKALLHVARYIFQVLKSLSFNGFLRFSLCSRCVETKASAQRLAERCLTGKHSAISYLFLI